MPWKIQGWGSFPGDSVQLHYPLESSWKNSCWRPLCIGGASLSSPLLKLQDLVLGFEQVVGARTEESCAVMSTGAELKRLCLEQKDRGWFLYSCMKLSQYLLIKSCAFKFTWSCTVEEYTYIFLIIWLVRKNRLSIIIAAAEVMRLVLNWDTTSEIFMDKASCCHLKFRLNLKCNGIG